MLRPKIALRAHRTSIIRGVAFLAALTACQPFRHDFSKTKAGDTHQDAMAQYGKALASAAALNLSYTPFWLLGAAPVSGDARVACYATSGIRDDDNNTYFSIHVSLPCPLLDGKTPATLLNVDSFHSQPRGGNHDATIGLIRAIPLLGDALPTCQDTTVTQVKSWKAIPGSDAYADSVKEALDAAAYTNITLIRGRALVLAANAKGVDIFPAPALCGLDPDLTKITGDAATKDWARQWGAVVQTGDSLYNDAHAFEYKLLTSPLTFWYRQFARLALGQKWQGGALDFQGNESEADAAHRIKAYLSQYLNDSLVGELTLVPTWHMDEKGTPHCFSWTPLTKNAATDRRLTYDSYLPWVAGANAKRFRDLNFPSLFFKDQDADAPGAEIAHASHYQLRYMVGQFTLDDKSDTAVMPLPLNGSEQGNPVCYGPDGRCTLFQGPNADSGHSCLDFLKTTWM